MFGKSFFWDKSLGLAEELFADEDGEIGFGFGMKELVFIGFGLSAIVDVGVDLGAGLVVVVGLS